MRAVSKSGPEARFAATRARSAESAAGSPADRARVAALRS